jgi:hypothetical protein
MILNKLAIRKVGGAFSIADRYSWVSLNNVLKRVFNKKGYP